MSERQWIPLESNPDVLTRYLHALGLSDAFGLSEVWSPEPELLALVPSPRKAVIFLLPLTPAILAAETAARQGASAHTAGQNPHPHLFFCKQTIGNACGTIALIHAVLNNASTLSLRLNSFFESFLERTKAMTPDERAKELDADALLDVTHTEFAHQGQTDAPNAQDKVDLHFVTFVESDGSIVELDGRKDGPVDHGPTTKQSLLEDACKVIKTKFMAADPEEMRFTILALTPSQQM